MVVNLRSKRLAHLFAEVYEQLPETDSTTLSHQSLLVVDDPIFLPKDQAPIFGAVIRVSVKKAILIVYLSPRKLPRQSDCFVRQVIRDLLRSITDGNAASLPQ